MNVMLTVLAAVRDWLVAMALAWVGVTMERVAESDAKPSATCSADASAPCND